LINLVVESEEQAVPQAKGLIEKAQNQLTDERLQQQLIDLIERIIVYKFPQKNREEIEAMFNLSDLKQTRFYQEAFTEGEANLVLRLLNRRLGKIPSSLIEQIRRLSIEQLENLGEALLDFGSEGDLIQWLEQNS
jgi:predicted transposase YdaD